jgi:hypothetical protein
MPIFTVPFHDYLDTCKRSVQASASDLFRRLDDALDPRIYIIAMSSTAQLNPILIHPQDGKYEPEWFREDLEKLRELDHAFHQETNALNDELATMMFRSFVKASVEKINRVNFGQDIITFVGEPIFAREYIVCPVLQLKEKVFHSYYSLSRWDKHEKSLLTEVTSIFLDEATDRMDKLKDPSAILKFIQASSYEILRKAGQRLLFAAAHAAQRADETKQEMRPEYFLNIGNMFDDCNVISRMKYEGEDCLGSILVTRKGHPDIETFIELFSPVHISNHRAVRKLLKLSSEEISLLCDSGSIYGLGKKTGSYNVLNEDLFDLVFTGHYTWKLRNADRGMMNVSYEQPLLPQNKYHISQNDLAFSLKQVFVTLPNESIEKLWQLVEAAIEQKHGTMVVISDRAAEESKRLAIQSTRIRPTILMPDLMKQITAIDGAVLINPNAECYAIGVILDGIVEEGKGDPSRGARYNAAFKYLALAQKKSHSCLIVTISEDGMVNIFPKSVSA